MKQYAEHAPYYLGSYLATAPPDGLAVTQYLAIIKRTNVAALFAVGGAIAFLLPARRWIALIPLMLAVVQLFHFGSPYRGVKDPDALCEETAGIRQLRDHLEQGDQGGGRFIRFHRNTGRFNPFSSVLPPSTNVPFRLRDVQGYNALSESTVGEVLEDCLGEKIFSSGIWSGKRILAPHTAPKMSHPILDLLSVRAAVTALPATVGNFRVIGGAGWKNLPCEGFRLFENRDALPRVRMVPFARGVSKEEARERLRGGDIESGRETFWIGEGTVGDSTAPAGSVRVVRESWNRVLLATNSATEQLLVLADTFSPGWRATIDGEVAPVLAVLGLIRGVILEEGKHEVLFRYEPPHFRWGAAFSLFGIGVAGLLVLRRSRRQSKGARRPD